jgi:hypothetical protein
MDFDVTSYALSWFKDRYNEKTLTIKPPYQRRPVWGLRQKVKLIESILLHLPIPELFIDETTDEEGQTRFAIIDGQQRTRAILQFLGLDRDPLEEDYNDFALDTLDSDSPYKDKTFKELTKDERKEFFSYKFSIRTLYNPSDVEVRDTFKRINQYLTKLNDQELRNATYSGPFVVLVETLANNKFWTTQGFFRTSHVRRMKDLQYVSELVIGVLAGPQGGSTKVVDEYYSNFEDYKDEIPNEDDIRDQYEDTLRTIETIFPDMKKSGRFKNLADFYSLFVAIASRHRADVKFPESGKGLAALRDALLKFSEEVDRRLSNPKAHVSDPAIKYARNVEKGVNDKSRRSARHIALTDVLEDHGVSA